MASPEPERMIAFGTFHGFIWGMSVYIISGMGLIPRYILRQALIATAFVAICLTCAIWLTQSLRFVDLIVNRGLSLATFGYLVMLLLPTFLSVVLPVAAFSAILFTYNKMNNDSELMVMRATGIGPLTLARPALILAAGSMAIGYALNLYFLPTGYRAFKDLQFQIRNNAASVLLQEGVFTPFLRGITVYVRERQRNGELAGLLVHDSRDSDKAVTYIAEIGALVSTAEGPRVMMAKGNRQEFDRKGQRLNILYFDQYTLDLGGVSRNVEDRWREPRERYLHELFNPHETEVDRQNALKLRAEGHQRLVSPLYTLAFAIIGVAALLSGQFSRRGQLGRILASVTAVVTIQGTGLGLSNLVSKVGLWAIPLMYANAVIPILAGLWLMLWRPGRKRAADAPAIA
ncbi:MAG: LPS export ABC transporter permease LptF [Alphaproteobacteria bacterium]|nr:LPS export ABC transporter permease LptF [Alphaproteobacteria bacterium]